MSTRKPRVPGSKPKVTVLPEDPELSGVAEKPAKKAAAKTTATTTTKTKPAGKAATPSSNKTKAKSTPAPKRRAVTVKSFSGRMAAILFALAVGTIILLNPVRLFIEQQAEIAEVKAKIEQEKQREQDLKSELERWNDPDYVVQEARKQLNLVRPGERQYIVNGAEGINDEQVSEQAEGPSDLPWADASGNLVKRAASAP